MARSKTQTTDQFSIQSLFFLIEEKDKNLKSMIDTKHNHSMEFKTLFKHEWEIRQNELDKEIAKQNIVLENQNRILAQQDKILTELNYKMAHLERGQAEIKTQVSTNTTDINELKNTFANIGKFTIKEIISQIAITVGILATFWSNIKDFINLK